AQPEHPSTSRPTPTASTGGSASPAVARDQKGRAEAGGSNAPREPSEPNGPRNPRGSVGGQTRSTGGSPLPGTGSQGQTDVRAVYIDPTGDAALNRELVNALTGKGVTTVTT